MNLDTYRWWLDLRNQKWRKFMAAWFYWGSAAIILFTIEFCITYLRTPENNSAPVPVELASYYSMWLHLNIIAIFAMSFACVVSVLIIYTKLDARVQFRAEKS